MSVQGSLETNSNFYRRIFAAVFLGFIMSGNSLCKNHNRVKIYISKLGVFCEER